MVQYLADDSGGNKSKGQYKGTYDQEFISVRFFIDENFNGRFGIKFSKNLVAEDLFTKNEKLFNELKKIIAPYNTITLICKI